MPVQILLSKSYFSGPILANAFAEWKSGDRALDKEAEMQARVLRCHSSYTPHVCEMLFNSKHMYFTGITKGVHIPNLKQLIDQLLRFGNPKKERLHFQREACHHHKCEKCPDQTPHQSHH